MQNFQCLTDTTVLGVCVINGRAEGMGGGKAPWQVLGMGLVLTVWAYHMTRCVPLYFLHPKKRPPT